MAPNAENLIWIDLEMTGLDPVNDKIIEIAAIATDANLNIIEEHGGFPIYQPDSILSRMDEWNQNQHSRSGLLERVKASTITEQMAEESFLEFCMKHVPPQRSPMCGNSICQDRRFLARWMRELERYFHYHNLDVTTFKILAKRWKPTLKGLKKKAAHLALEDVRESIEELRYYRANFIKE